MKISKKRAKLLRHAINDTIYEIIQDPSFFDQTVISSVPDASGVTGWSEDDIKWFDMLSELSHKLEVNIFGPVFTE